MFIILGGKSKRTEIKNQELVISKWRISAI
jgi:hypothetical protein